MTEWKRQGETVCMPNTVCCAMAADGEEARMIVAAHNADCDAYEARIADLKARVLEAEAKLDDVRMGIGCARGQRSTQYCAEAVQRDEVITKLLEMLLPDDHESKCNCDECRLRRETYARACEIAGRTE